MACGPSEDSDQPGHPPSLTRAFAVQADLSLRWAHIQFCRFCRALAQIYFYKRLSLGYTYAGHMA